MAPHPSLVQFLSANYLNGLISYGVEIKVNVEVMKYHSAYFLDASWWLKIDIMRAADFVRDTNFIMMLCRLVSQLLRSRADQEDLALRRLDEFLDKWSKPIA